MGIMWIVRDDFVHAVILCQSCRPFLTHQPLNKRKRRKNLKQHQFEDYRVLIRRWLNGMIEHRKY